MKVHLQDLRSRSSRRPKLMDIFLFEMIHGFPLPEVPMRSISVQEQCRVPLKISSVRCSTRWCTTTIMFRGCKTVPVVVLRIAEALDISVCETVELLEVERRLYEQGA